MIRNDGTLFRRAVDAVARELVIADHREGFSFVKTPLTYPSGSGVVIRVGDSYPDFLVTDFGCGYEEADLMGGSGIYVRSARAIAETAGISFDSHAFFVLKVPRDQLAGSNRHCSELLARSSVGRGFPDEREAGFRGCRIALPEASGRASSPNGYQRPTQWHVATLVSDGPHPPIFEPVSSHHTSIFAAVTRFSDISKVEKAPTLVAIVRKKTDLKTYLAVLSQEAHVIENDVSDSVIARLAA